MADNTEFRAWCFLSLLVGGILIVVGGLMGTFRMGLYGWSGMGAMSDMMGDYVGDGSLSIMTWWSGGVGVVTGAFVLFSAAQIYRERDVSLWAVVAIVAGALSLVAMGGFVIGAVAAIAGGALALVDRQRSVPRGGRA